MKALSILNKSTIILWVLALLIMNDLKAKDKVFKIMPVKKADLVDKPFKDYPESKIRLLFDFGQVEIYPEGDAFLTRFSRVMRIKFLGDTVYSPYLLGFDQATIASQILIYTLNNGKLETIDITDRWPQMDKYLPFSESIPELKPGAIIEFKLETDLPSPHVIPGWQFEYEIPVDWSEFKATVPDIFDFRPVFKGYVPMVVNTGEIKLDKNGNWVEGDGYFVYQYRFAVEKVAPFKTVSFSPSSSDYLTSVDFYLERIKAYKTKPETTGKTWDELTRILDRSDQLGGKCSQFSLKSVMAVDTTSDLPLLVGRIYHHLKSKLSVNGEIGILSDRSLNEVYESGSGSVQDMNLLLVAALRGYGLEAAPVILRTRERGSLNMNLPQLSQFNYLIALVMLDGHSILLDVSDDCLEPGILRTSCLNGKGLVVRSGFEDWIDLEGQKISGIRTSIQAQIEGDKLLGEVLERRNGQIAWQDCKKFNDGKFIVKPTEGVNILDISYADVDSIWDGNSIRISCDASSLMEKDLTGIAINPFWFERITTNPFTEKDRIYPVVFDFLFNNTYNFSLTLPENYKLVDLPKTETLSTPDNSIRLIYTSKQLGQIVQISAQFSMIKKRYETTEYDGLQDFYKEVIKKMDENIKVRKK